jgi:hypothetical protein
MAYTRSDSCSVAIGLGDLVSQYLTVLSQLPVTTHPASWIAAIARIGASCYPRVAAIYVSEW